MIEIVPSLLFVRRVLLLSLTSEETATESILRPSAQDDTLPSLVVAPFKTSRQEIGSSNTGTLLKRRKFLLAIPHATAGALAWTNATADSTNSSTSWGDEASQ